MSTRVELPPKEAAAVGVPVLIAGAGKPGVLRFLIATLLLNATLAVGLTWAAKKPKPPEYKQCKGAVCLSGLKWQEDFTIEGTLSNNSTAPISGVTLEFDVYSGPRLVGNTSAGIESIPAGGQWFFTASLVLIYDERYVMTKVQPARIRLTTSDHQYINETLEFQPVCGRGLGKFCR